MQCRPLIKTSLCKQACTIKSRPHVTATDRLRLERSLLALQNYKSNKCVTNNASQPKARNDHRSSVTYGLTDSYATGISGIL